MLCIVGLHFIELAGVAFHSVIVESLEDETNDAIRSSQSNIAAIIAPSLWPQRKVRLCEEHQESNVSETAR